MYSYTNQVLQQNGDRYHMKQSPKKKKKGTSDLASALIVSQMQSAAESPESKIVSAVEVAPRAKPTIFFSSSSLLIITRLQAVSEREKIPSLLKHDIEELGFLRFEEIFSDTLERRG